MFDVMRDDFGFVEVKVAHEESALMRNVKLVNRVYTQDFTIRYTVGATPIHPPLLTRTPNTPTAWRGHMDG